MTRLDQRARSREITDAEASRIEMQVFDRLPESYRDLIRYAQIEIPATVARAYLSAFGRHLGLLLLKWAVDARGRKTDERHASARRTRVSPPAPQPYPVPPPQAQSRTR
jgi:hypothetical protein